VGDHAFPRGGFVPSAVVTSHVGMRAGVSYHQVPGFAQLPSLVSNNGPTEVDLRTINVAETLDFGVRLHDHVGLFGEAYGRARIGANTATLLGDGVDYTYGGDVGLLIKLFRVRGFQVSVSGQLGAYTGQSAGIAALFQDLNAIARNTVAKVQNDPKFDLNKAVAQLNTAFRTATADLLTPFNGFKYGFALNVAQSLGRYAGLQASLGYIADSAKYRPTHYDETLGGPVAEEKTVTITRPAFGLAVDVDTSPAGIPIALMLEYRMTPVTITDTDHAGENNSSLEHLISLGVFYSGRTDLQLGVTAYTVAGQPPALGADSVPSGKPFDLAVQLVFRYYW